MRHAETAPAKLNLRLRVSGKREDGFHDIDTLMVVVEGVADTLEFHLGRGEGAVELSCDDPDLPTGSDNLVLRAFSVFRRATGVAFTGRVELAKRIPSGAGLGGGSSDAAATLRALDRIAGTGLGAGNLRQLASEIGSDVAFFVTGEASVCRGRGEILSPFDRGVPPTRVVLAKPAFGVPSAWAYRHWAGSTPLEGVDYQAQEAPWGEAVNDLERPVFEKHLALPAMKGWLQRRPETGIALMSGSGSTVFATLAEGADAEALLVAMRAEFGGAAWIRAASIG